MLVDTFHSSEECKKGIRNAWRKIKQKCDRALHFGGWRRAVKGKDEEEEDEEG
jgi:hypothetical protein